jgi:hypothetical protein
MGSARHIHQWCMVKIELQAKVMDFEKLHTMELYEATNTRRNYTYKLHIIQ